MAAFVHDHLPVVFYQRVHLALPGDGRHDGDVDLARELGLATADGADHALANAQKSPLTFLPLLEQFRSMHQHQCVHTPARDHCGGSDRFAKGRWSAQHAVVVMQHSGNRQPFTARSATKA